MVSWSYILHPSKLLDFSAHKKRATNAARVGSSLKNMHMRIDQNSLSMTHAIFPQSLNNSIMTKEIKLQGYATQKAPFQHHRFSGLVLQVFINSPLAAYFLPLMR